MKEDNQAKTNPKTGEKVFENDVDRVFADGGNPGSKFLDSHGGLCKLLGDVNLLDTRKNGIVEGRITLKLPLKVVVFDALTRNLKQSGLGGFPGCLVSQLFCKKTVAIGFQQSLNSEEQSFEIVVINVQLGLDDHISRMLLTVALLHQIELLLLCLDLCHQHRDFRHVVDTRKFQQLVSVSLGGLGSDDICIDLRQFGIHKMLPCRAFGNLVLGLLLHDI